MPKPEVTEDEEAALTQGGDRDNGQGDAEDTHSSEGNTASRQVLVAEIEHLQQNALLLLNFVAGRSEVMIGSGLVPAKIRSVSDTSGTTDPRSTFLLQLSEVLKETPEKVSQDPGASSFLFAAIDYLTWLAKPATVHTIRLTQAYTEPSKTLPNEPEFSKQIKKNAHYIRRTVQFIALAGFFSLCISLMLMAHVVSGQQILDELSELRDEQRILLTQQIAAQASFMDQAGPNAQNTGDLFCPEKGKPYLNQAHQLVCASLSDLGAKMSLTYAQLKSWNGASDRFYNLFPIPNWFRPQMKFSPEGGVIGEDQWNGTELRTVTMLHGMSAYGIPMLLGFIGAVAYVLRRISYKVDNCALEPRDFMQSLLRVILGLILGGLVAIAFDPGGFDVQGLRLSLWLIAFLVGYAVQIIFQALDYIVERGLAALTGAKERITPDHPVPILGAGQTPARG